MNFRLASQILDEFRSRRSSFILVILCFVNSYAQDKKERARDLGVPFDGTPGALNAITDVKSVEVGHTTLISGEGPLKVGVGPVRTGVTAVFPRGKDSNDPVFAAWFTENGNGEMTGTTWVEESGSLEGPVMMTNTHSVGTVRDAVIAWRLKRHPPSEDGYSWSLPVVAETWDGYLNDVNGFHVRPDDVFHALDTATSGAVEEGNVGGGTGMICNEFKGGIGTSSRVVASKYGGYTVGVLVQCNYGQRDQLRIAGVPVGREIPGNKIWDDDVGSIIVVVATDAPLIPTQLNGWPSVSRWGWRGTAATPATARAISSSRSPRPTLALKRSGDSPDPLLSNDRINPIFLATVQATEEAVVNAMVAARTMSGKNGRTVMALPHDQLREILKKYNRLVN